ncbi:MAG: peptidoglycan DD-metalloendopeptidase family protein [Terriglobales bacterium]
MRKRYYIFIVTHDWDGQLRRIRIPVQWVVLFVIFALVGAGTLLGLAGSYTHMLTKVRRFDDLRQERTALVQQLASARKETQQTRAEVASLGSLASEVSSLYSFGRHLTLAGHLQTVSADGDSAHLYSASLRNFEALETGALDGRLLDRLGEQLWRPDIWPVQGWISSPFGERRDPFTGEGAFHPGIDIAVDAGTPVRVAANGRVTYAARMEGYGKCVIVSHGHGFTTLYAHLSAFAVAVGQHVSEGEVIAYSGDSGRSTGPHLHYEVRIHNVPVNPYPYL